MSIIMKGVTYALEGKKLVDDINIRIDKRELVGFLGPNGAGKSTVLKLITGEIRPSTGEITMIEKDMTSFSAKELAFHRAVMSQTYFSTFPIKVWALISLSRVYFNESIEKTSKIVSKVLNMVDGLELANREVSTLSGGEKQKILIARALAQIDQPEEGIKTPKYLLLDEPTAALDLCQTSRMMGILRQAVDSLELGALIIDHDIIAVQKYCDRCYLIKSGKILFSGSPRSVINAETIAETYDIEPQTACAFVLN